MSFYVSSVRFLMVLGVVVAHLFSVQWMNIHSLSTLLLMASRVVSMGLLQVGLPCMFLYLSFGEHMNAFLLDTNLGVES